LVNDPRLAGLAAAVLVGDSAKSVSLARALLDSGIGHEVVVVHGIEAAMSALDDRCTLEQFNLLEIMLAGRAVTEVMRVLYPGGPGPADTKATVVLATLEGDVHDLGKNVLKGVLAARGYRVVDCGKDCPVERILDAAASERPLAVGISGLITSIIPQVRQVKGLLARRGLDHVRVLAGGAALKQSSAERLDVDFVAGSAFDAARYLDRELRGQPHEQP
jgi:methanogenic corrinoid protein MtbC1